MKIRNQVFILTAAVCIPIVLMVGFLFWCVSYNPWGFSKVISPQEKAVRSRIIAAAESYLGANEQDGSHQTIIDVYNSHHPLAMDYEVTYTDSWCAAFVSAAAIEQGLTDIVPTECSCERQIELFKSIDRWQERDAYLPLPGDLIYYDWDDGRLLRESYGWSDHVGIVVATAGPFIMVIEGNKEDSVSYRYLSILHPGIRGYGLPDYTSKS